MSLSDAVRSSQHQSASPDVNSAVGENTECER